MSEFPLAHVSWSTVSAYSSCPACMFATRIDRRPRRVTPSLVVGSAVHGAMAALRRGMASDDAVDAARTEAGRTLMGEDRTGELGDADPVLELGAKFASWSAVEEKYLSLLPHAAVIIEAERRCTIVGVEEALDFSNLFSQPFVGFADVILEREDGYCLVKDLKTSAKDSPPDDSAFRQMACYAMAAGVVDVGVDMITTTQKPTVHPWTDPGYGGTITPALFVSVTEQVEWAIAGIQRGDFPVGSGGRYGHEVQHVAPLFYSMAPEPVEAVA